MRNVFRKCVLMTASFALTAGILAGGTVRVHADDWPDPHPVMMYRLYNPNSGEHFYTSAQKEKDHLVSIGWRDEGYGWIGCSKDPGDPVYRLYNRNGGEHHYTMSTKERDALVKAGWKYEGIGWYSYNEKKDVTGTGKPEETVYREYNPNAFSNNHNYTSDPEEHKHLISLGWKDEGKAWKAKYRNVLKNVTGFAYNANTRTITWNPVKHAVNYDIEIRKDQGNGDFEPILFEYSTDTSYVIPEEGTVFGSPDAGKPGRYYATINVTDYDGNVISGADAQKNNQSHYLDSRIVYGAPVYYFDVK